MTKIKKLLALSLIVVGAFSLAACQPEEEGPTDLEQLAEALDELELASQASADLTLLTTGLHDVEIAWTSSNTDVIANDGTLTIPLFTEGDEVVTITASLTLGTDTLTKVFEVTVLAAATITDAEVLADAVGRLLLSHDDLVASDISLPATVDLTDIEADADVTWASSDVTVMSDAGVVIRPANGDGNASITLTATLTYNDETATKAFPITVKETAPSVAFTTVDAMHTVSVLGDIVEFQGIVTATFDGGYFLTDGTNALGIYTGSMTDFVIGDEVYVQGSYAVYNTLYQIGTLTIQTLITSDNANPLTAVDMSVADMIALDSSDPLINGMYYSVTGTIGLCGSYDNVCILDGDDSFLVYYKSLPDSIAALEDKVGMEVIIEVIYYTDHATDGVLVVFQGGADDIEINELNDVDALAADLDAVDANVPGVALSSVTLPAEGPNGTLYTNWASDMEAVMMNDGTFVAQAGTSVTVTFTADAERGTETGTATIEVVVPVMSTVEEVLDMNSGDFFQVTGVVYEESYYGFFIHANGSYLFVYESSINDSVVPGQEITILGFVGSYNGLTQANVVSYEIGGTQNGLVGTVISSVSGLQFDLVQRGTIAMVTGTISIEGSYDNVYITGPAGGKVVVYYRSNAGELEEFDGQIVTVLFVTYHDETVLFQGLAADVVVLAEFTDKQVAKATVDAIDLGDLDNLEADMTLPIENLVTEADIVWSTSDAGVITDAGVVTRTPGMDTYATLTASVTIGDDTKTREFDVTVLDANGATPINVAAALALTDGDSVLVVGVVTGFYYEQPMIQDPDGTAIYIDAELDEEVEIGDEVVIRGTLETATSYGDDQRRVTDAYLLETLSSGNALFIFDTYTVDEVYTLYPVTSSQRITLTNVVIAEMDDGYGYASIASGTQNIVFKYPAYWKDVYEVGDTLATITFNVVDINYDNLRVSAVELPVLTEAQNMLAAKALISISDTVTGNLTLDTEFVDYNATIVWTSTDVTVIALDGTVVRPAEGEADVEVTLEAEITIGTTVETMTFVVDVLALIAPELFISEYIEGGGYNKAIEIYNPTDAEIDLADYILRYYNAGGGTFTEYDLVGTIASGGVYILGNNNALTSDDIKTVADELISFINHNGDDCYELVKNGVVIDSLGVWGDVDWGKDKTLVRNSDIVAGNMTYDVNEWTVEAKDTMSNLGDHVCDKPTA